MKKLAAYGLLILVVISLAGCEKMFSKKEEYAKFESPDGKYKIVVFRKSKFFGQSPGQSGDAPGEVELQDRQGNVLQSADVEMVQLVEKVEWTDKKVHIKLVADWDLPE